MLSLDTVKKGVFVRDLKTKIIVRQHMVRPKLTTRKFYTNNVCASVINTMSERSSHICNAPEQDKREYKC